MGETTPGVVQGVSNPLYIVLLMPFWNSGESFELFCVWYTRGYDTLDVIFIGRNIFEMDEVVITSGRTQEMRLT
jgi:hypothetical protein